LDSFDPLEETVGADDIRGRNNCPVVLRITAIHQLDYDARVTFQRCDVRYCVEKEEKKHTRKRLGMWALINGKVVATDSHDLAERLSVKYQSISSMKSKAQHDGNISAKIAGVIFWWNDPNILLAKNMN